VVLLSILDEYLVYIVIYCVVGIVYNAVTVSVIAIDVITNWILDQDWLDQFLSWSGLD